MGRHGVMFDCKCGRYTRHEAHGMCNACYSKWRRMNSPEKATEHCAKWYSKPESKDIRKKAVYRFRKAFKHKYGVSYRADHKPGTRVLAGTAKLPGTVWSKCLGRGALASYLVRLDDGYGTEQYKSKDLKFLSWDRALFERWHEQRSAFVPNKRSRIKVGTNEGPPLPKGPADA